MPNFTGALAALSGLPQGFMEAQRFNQQQAEQQALLELNKLRMQEIARQRLQEQQQAKLAFGAAQNLFGQPQQPMVPQQQPMVPSGGMNLPAVPSYGPGGGMPTDAQLDLARRAMAQGYPPAAAAGMAGSMTGESGRNLDPYALNPRSGALGEAQWLGPRKAALLSRPNPLSRETQTGFLFDELRGPEASTGQRLMSATDPAQAARDFTTGFERPGNVNMAPREQAARAIYAQLSPDQQMQAQDAAVSTAAAIPPQMAGRLTISQLAQAINRQAGPEVSDEAKFGALVALSKLAMPDQQQQLHQQWEAFKFGVGEQDKAATRAETAARDRATEEYRRQRLAQGADGKGADWSIVQTPDGRTMRVNRATGETAPVDLPAGTAKLGASGAGARPEADPQKDTMAKAIAEYRLAPLSGWALRTPWGKQTMENVIALNPDYQATEYAARTSASRAFASGRQGDAVRFVNVAIDHLGVADQLAEALQNNDTRALNQLKNVVQRQLGYEAPINFETAKLIVGDEVAKAVIGGVGAATDRIELQRNLDAANSPEQLRGVSQTLKRLMAGQLGGLERQFKTGTGQTQEKFEEKLSPNAQRELGQYMQQGQGTAPGQIIEKGGKRWRIIGGDPNDPDVEEVK